MNEMVNKFLLAGEEFMPKMVFRQLGFACNTYILHTVFAKHSLKTKKVFKHLKKWDSQYTYQNELDALILLNIQKLMDIKRVLLQWFITFLIKRLQLVLLKMKSCKRKS